MKKILITLLVVVGLIVGLVRIGIGNWAFFSDIEVSSENVSGAGTWNNNPSLSLDPDDAEKETSGSSVGHSIWVTNSGDAPKDVAKNVELGVSIVKGGEYISQILYDPVIGDIEPGGVREFALTVELTGWEGAPEEEEVKLRIEVTREDNRPELNVGRRAHFTIEKGD